MSPFVVNSLIVVSLIICVIAIVYIRKHYGQIRDAKQLQEDTRVQMSKRYDEQRAYLIESVQVIARAIGSDEKLSYTEACMRLAALLLQNFLDIGVVLGFPEKSARKPHRVHDGLKRFKADFLGHQPNQATRATIVLVHTEIADADRARS